MNKELTPSNPAAYISPYIIPIKEEGNQVPVGISARHIHLSEEDVSQLFGYDYRLQPFKYLKQPGQFATEETLKLVGPTGYLDEVRILGPERPESQVELAGTDAYHLGVKPPVRDSGELKDTPGIVLVGPKGAINLPKGVIIASAHIHMHPTEAKKLDLSDGDRVQVLMEGERSLIFNNVLIRVNEAYALEFHLDTDEANAGLIKNGDTGYVIAKRLLM